MDDPGIRFAPARLLRLQTDPNVINATGQRFDGNLRKRDLTTDGPYNSQKVPGPASLKAVLNPPDSDYLYIVARGDGGSVFARTVAAQKRALWPRIRRRVKRR